MSKVGIRATCINGEHKDDELLAECASGAYQLIYTSPELLEAGKAAFQLFKSSIFKQRVIAFVIDEAHLVQLW